MEDQSLTTSPLLAEKSASGSRKRRRPALACESCRARKIKCDRNTPCNKCVRSKKARSCTYVSESDHVSTRATTPSQGASNKRTSPQPTNRPPSHSRIRVVEGTPLGHPVEPIPEVEQRATAQTSPAPRPVSAPDQPTRTTHIKGKLFGASHWTNAIENLPNMLRIDRLDLARNSQLPTLMAKCKKYARDAKKHPPVHEAKISELRDKIPARNVADQLVEHYLETFETVFCIHHVPSFRREYEHFWSDPAAASDFFTVRLLLILALGTCFDDDDSVQSLHASSVHWVIAAHAWAYSPFAKPRVTLYGVQIQCLLVLARQTHAVGGDMVWISAGTLLRTAMQVGLNRDPSHFQNIPTIEAEVRRKVWATTVELLVQSCIDSGQPPLISTDDFDCEHPADVHDFHVATRKSAQNMLLDSLPVRLQIANFLNHFRSDLTYSAALNLSTQLTKSIRTQTASYTPSSRCETFQLKMVEFLTYRFLIALHQAFAGRAKTSPAFYFSRKMCVDASLLILDFNKPEPALQTYKKVMALGNGLYHTTLLQAAVCIVLELLWQNDEAFAFSSLVTQSSIASQREQKEAIQFYTVLLRERLKKGQGNFKVYVLVSLAVVHLENLKEKEFERIEMSRHLERMLQECVDTLAKTVPARPELLSGQNGSENLGADVLTGLDFDISNLPHDFDVPEIFSLSDDLLSEQDFWLFQN